MNFLSDEARHLDLVYREVNGMHENLQLSLVLCRQKLAPFLDDGFVHKDRKKKRSGPNDGLAAPKCNARIDNKIKEAKVLMTRALKDNKVFELETIIDSITLNKDGTKESDKIYNDLRLHLIHS
jgi:hypothetical protein